MWILLILAHFEASARVLVNCFYRFACRSSRVFGHLGDGRSFSKVIVFQGIFDHPPCIGLTKKLSRFKIFDIKRYLFFRSIRFTIKITPKLILVSRPPHLFQNKTGNVRPVLKILHKFMVVYVSCFISSIPEN